MGSSGSDKFQEYREPPKKDGSKKSPRGGEGPRGAPPGGPEEGANKCEEPLKNVALEEVGISEYYDANKDVPPSGTGVSVRGSLVQGRIAVATQKDEIIGVMPVEYNYLRRCIEQGFLYSGHVVVSSKKPIPTVRVSLSGQR